KLIKKEEHRIHFHLKEGENKMASVILKIGLHIGAILFFIFGLVLIHVVINLGVNISINTLGINTFYPELSFFDIELSRDAVADIGFLSLGISFFIELFLSFKPIKVIFENK
ncbi:MAG: hypothetical protein ACFFKA_07890, partial [Candidatus Thorarchaeota archaeon]